MVRSNSARCVLPVQVQEDRVLALCRSRARITRPAHAGIALAQQLEGHAAGLRDRHRIIGRFIVYQDQFYRCMRLCGHGAQGLGQKGGAVVHRHDDRNRVGPRSTGRLLCARLHVSAPDAMPQRLRHAGWCPGRLRR